MTANIARGSPAKASKAIPKLLLNAKDSGTVIRWSAAVALTEIAKSDSKLRKSLVRRFAEIAKKEKNSGVRNVYLKALKQLAKPNECAR